VEQKTFLILGAKGQVGIALKHKFPNAQTADIDELDITDRVYMAMTGAK
jgi:dTDP-4-dehydrorhamnose reductase